MDPSGAQPSDQPAEQNDPNSLKPEGAALKNQTSEFAADLAAWRPADAATDL